MHFKFLTTVFLTTKNVTYSHVVFSLVSKTPLQGNAA